MTRYAKLANNYPQFAPNPIIINGRALGNPPGEIYLEQGWLPVRFTEAPEAEPGWHYEETWAEESGEIVQGWELVREPDDISADEAIDIILGGAT